MAFERSPDAFRRTPGAVQGMFDAVAPGYDRMNRLLSVGLDRGWRKAARARLLGGAPLPGDRILDLCCGTGDLALEVPRELRTVGCDFTPAMLGRAQVKAEARRRPIAWVAGDAMRLPFPDGSFDGATVGFGVRNLPDLGAGLAEILRVLVPGGRLVVLEFSRPGNAGVRLLHGAWLRLGVPTLAALAAPGRAPYGYLRDSILDFPDADDLAASLRAAGFGAVSWTKRTLGTVAIHSGAKPEITTAA